VKELVYHRQLLPALERFSNRVGFHDGDYHGTWEQHGDRVVLRNARSALPALRAAGVIAAGIANNHAADVPADTRAALIAPSTAWRELA